MPRLFSLVVILSLHTSPSLTTEYVHRAPDDFLKSWVEGPIRLGEPLDLTLGAPANPSMQLLRHTRLIPVNESTPTSSLPCSKVEAWRDYYIIQPHPDGHGFQVSLSRDGSWREAGRLPDCVLTDSEWFEGSIYFLMRPVKTFATSTHLYCSHVTPSGVIRPPVLAALAPPGVILEKFTVTRDGLYGVGRIAGDERRRLLGLRGLDSGSPGWSDCGEVYEGGAGEWDMTSRGSHLVLCSPLQRDIEYCVAPRLGDVAQWERKRLDQGPWLQALSTALGRLETKSGIPPRLIHQFSLPHTAEVLGVRMEAGGKTPPRLRWRVANAVNEVYGDWSKFYTGQYVPIGELAQFVQYEIRPSEEESTFSINEVVLMLGEALGASCSNSSVEGNKDQTPANTRLIGGPIQAKNLIQSTAFAIPSPHNDPSPASMERPDLDGEQGSVGKLTDDEVGPTNEPEPADERSMLGAGKDFPGKKDGTTPFAMDGIRGKGAAESRYAANHGSKESFEEQTQGPHHNDNDSQDPTKTEADTELPSRRGDENHRGGMPGMSSPASPGSSVDQNGEAGRFPSSITDRSLQADGQSVEGRNDHSGNGGETGESEEPGPLGESSSEGDSGGGKGASNEPTSPDDSGGGGPQGDSVTGETVSPSASSGSSCEAGDSLGSAEKPGFNRDTEGAPVADDKFCSSTPPGQVSPVNRPMEITSGTNEALDRSRFGRTSQSNSGINPIQPKADVQGYDPTNAPSIMEKATANYLIPLLLGLMLALLTALSIHDMCGQQRLMIAPLLRPVFPPKQWEEERIAETTHANQIAAESALQPGSSSQTRFIPSLPILPERRKGKVEWRVAEPLPRPMAPASAFYHHGAVYVVDPHGTICYSRLRADGSLCPWGVRVGRLPSRSNKGLTALVESRIVCVSGGEISVACIDEGVPGEWHPAGKLDGLREATAVVGMGNRLYIVSRGSNGNPFPAVRSIRIDNRGGLGDAQSHPPLPLGVTEGALVAGGNCLYWIGGMCQRKASRKVFSARILPDSQFEEWRLEPDLPWGQSHPTAESWGGALWVVLNKPIGEASRVFTSQIDGNGSIMGWKATGQPLPEPVYSASLPFIGGRFLLLGGWMKTEGRVPRTEVRCWNPA